MVGDDNEFGHVVVAKARTPVELRGECRQIRDAIENESPPERKRELARQVFALELADKLEREEATRGEEPMVVLIPQSAVSSRNDGPI
jgi:hypothetical protein